ncbi:MAG: ABC transporter substrate-binding protein [Treponema sp.]|nr:ABC transporter substrate-binding protein [Treponema sp.]
MKRSGFIALVCIFLAAMILTVGCKKSETTAGAAAGTSASRAPVEITVMHSKIETDSALKAYAALYERQTGVKVNVRSVGGDTSLDSVVRSMLAAGDEPEIIAIEGRAGYEEHLAGGRITDLSDQAWARDTDVAYIDASGRTVGFPMAIEGWGLGYNKSILDRAGINPATLINVNAIRAAFERLDSMKAQLGIDAVVSMAASADMSWVPGNHGTNTYLALGLPYNNSRRYIDMMLSGQVDNTRLTAFAEYMNLLFRYSNRTTLLAGGYDQQVGEFVIGKTVFVHQGNWIDPNMAEFGATFEVGYIPHAMLTENTDGIFVGAPWYYIVNSKSRNVEEAKKFLNAMATTRDGHDYMVTQAGMIPAFKSVTLTPSGGFSKAVQAYANQGKIYAWQQNDMPSGFGGDTLGPIYNQLASGSINVARFVELFRNAVATLAR